MAALSGFTMEKWGRNHFAKGGQSSVDGCGYNPWKCIVKYSHSVGFDFKTLFSVHWSRLNASSKFSDNRGEFSLNEKGTWWRQSTNFNHFSTFSSATLQSKHMTGSSVLTASITQNLMDSCLNFLQIWRLSDKVIVNEISLKATSSIAVSSSDVSPAKRRSSRDSLPWKALHVFTFVMQVEIIDANEGFNDWTSWTLFWKLNTLEMFPLSWHFSPIDYAQATSNSVCCERVNHSY